MAYCRHCGKEIYDDSVFCSFCGKTIVEKNELDVVKSSDSQSKVLGIISMILGIASIYYMALPAGIVALILSKKVTSPKWASFAKAGKITGIIGIVFGSIYTVLMIFVITVYIFVIIFYMLLFMSMFMYGM